VHRLPASEADWRLLALILRILEVVEQKGKSCKISNLYKIAKVMTSDGMSASSTTSARDELQRQAALHFSKATRSNRIDLRLKG
jgi:hypothetical protein